MSLWCKNCSPWGTSCRCSNANNLNISLSSHMRLVASRRLAFLWEKYDRLFRNFPRWKTRNKLLEIFARGAVGHLLVIFCLMKPNARGNRAQLASGNRSETANSEGCLQMLGSFGDAVTESNSQLYVEGWSVGKELIALFCRVEVFVIWLLFSSLGIAVMFIATDFLLSVRRK